VAELGKSQESLVTNREWSDIPYFRKPFFLVVLFLLFMPGYLLMIWTGDTYHKKNGIVYRTSLKAKQRITAIVVLLMVTYLVRRFR
jgi:nicotinamide riboside transporter PnuC